ncbi:hypothetical protein A2U01_0088837, partial [Trifolium medium]|nr:hypothetical protein [Trifolium medium]
MKTQGKRKTPHGTTAAGTEAKHVHLPMTPTTVEVVALHCHRRRQDSVSQQEDTGAGETVESGVIRL